MFSRRVSQLKSQKNRIIFFNSCSFATLRKTHYEILGVERTATNHEIQKAYYSLAKQYHPDVTSKKNTTEMFQQISQAYQILSQPKSREDYDIFIDDFQFRDRARKDDQKEEGEYSSEDRNREGYSVRNQGWTANSQHAQRGDHDSMRRILLKGIISVISVYFIFCFLKKEIKTQQPSLPIGNEGLHGLSYNRVLKPQLPNIRSPKQENGHVRLDRIVAKKRQEIEENFMGHLEQK